MSTPPNVNDPIPTPHPSQLEPFFVEQIAQMKAHLEAVRDLPGLERFQETHALPAAFFERFNAALMCFDRIIDFVLGFDGTDQRVRCKKGCSNCCIDLVRGISTPEIINIYHYVRGAARPSAPPSAAASPVDSYVRQTDAALTYPAGWPDAKQVFEYHRDSAGIFMEILQSKLEPGEHSFGGQDPRVVEAHTDYNRRNRPCGFLDQTTGCCRIYPVRPIACRYFFSLDPPEHCSPLHVMYHQRDTRTVHLPPEIHVMLLDIGRKLGFRPLNYLAGAFCGFAAEIMHARPITVGEQIPATGP